MYTKVITSALLASAAMVSAAPSIRSAYPTMPASQYTSFSLEAWGPQETNAKGKAVFVDSVIASAEHIKDLKSKGKTVVCYISAGTVENWRDDKSAFQSGTAKKYKGFGGTETWLDITNWQSFKAPMEKRIKDASAKGCQLLEYDNVDCDVNMCVSGKTYQELASKQVEYLKWLVSTAHSNGMGVGLKNAQSHIKDVGSSIEFAINEECQKYSECNLYSPLVNAGKTVFGVEYDNNGGKVCQEAKANKMVTKYRNGGKWADCF